MHADLRYSWVAVGVGDKPYEQTRAVEARIQEYDEGEGGKRSKMNVAVYGRDR